MYLGSISPAEVQEVATLKELVATSSSSAVPSLTNTLPGAAKILSAPKVITNWPATYFALSKSIVFNVPSTLSVIFKLLLGTSTPFSVLFLHDLLH